MEPVPRLPPPPPPAGPGPPAPRFSSFRFALVTTAAGESRRTASRRWKRKETAELPRRLSFFSGSPALGVELGRCQDRGERGAGAANSTGCTERATSGRD